MYSPAAVARRRCTATRADGEPCRRWARWDDEGQRCNVHAGRGHYGPQTPGWKFSPPARYLPCRCAAYTFQHRPGGGLCRWPDPPQYRRTTPLGTRGWRSEVRRRIRNGHLVFEARSPAELKQKEGGRWRRPAARSHCEAGRSSTSGRAGGRTSWRSSQRRGCASPTS